MTHRSTVEKGNAFRDVVDAILAAAGFQTRKEVREAYKKADIGALWGRDSFDGPVRYLIEAKNYEGTLALDVCTAFAVQYGNLVRAGHADRAWLISRGGVSPDGRAAIEADPNLKCFTFEEFQRRLFGIDSYLHEIIAQHEAAESDVYYIRPHTEADEDLEEIVRGWIAEEDTPPLAIVGGYGKGKSTFARHLSAALAGEALTNPLRRVPILVPLGEIVDEQSLEGLLGKVFTSRHRVRDYHFQLFEELNRAGRFVVIFDGFDEMKHGMTLPVFERVIVELMRLDRGAAKILILGRDTVFHDDVEFKSIILGRQVTATGFEIRARERREFRHVTLREFTLDEAQRYVRTYFPLRFRDQARGQNGAVDPAWIERRVGELIEGGLDELLKRPVHAQMLCEIATEPETQLRDLSKFKLYDYFLHFLVDREVRKAGRYHGFTREVRRRFNAALAWWLWEQGNISTTTLANIPAALCSEAVKGVAHEFDETSLRRELTAGCLIEKAGGTIYFGHRSLQEFLVAEHLAETDLLYRRELGRGDLARTMRMVNAEVIDFLAERVEAAPDGRPRATEWLSYLEGWRYGDVPLSGFELFLRLAEAAGFSDDARDRSPWHFWLGYFLVDGVADFRIGSDEAAGRLEALFALALEGPRDLQAAGFLLVARALRRTPERRVRLGPGLLARWLPREALKKAVRRVEESRREIVRVQSDDSLPFWMFLDCTRIERRDNGGTEIVIDLERLQRRATSVLGLGFAPEGEEASVPEMEVPILPVYRAMSRMKASDTELERLRPFFNDAALRSRIRPLEVERVLRRSS